MGRGATEGISAGHELSSLNYVSPLQSLQEAFALALMFSCIRVFWVLLGQKFSMRSSFATCDYTSILLNTVCQALC